MVGIAAYVSVSIWIFLAILVYLFTAFKACLDWTEEEVQFRQNVRTTFFIPCGMASVASWPCVHGIHELNSAFVATTSILSIAVHKWDPLPIVGYGSFGIKSQPKQLPLRCPLWQWMNQSVGGKWQCWLPIASIAVQLKLIAHCGLCFFFFFQKVTYNELYTYNAALTMSIAVPVLAANYNGSVGDDRQCWVRIAG